MILVLSLLLGFLLVAAYLIRRYLLPQGLTKRGTPIRVLTRVNVTPKATIALVEVPGKVLVVGITSQTLTTLGELEKEDPGVLLQQRGTGTQAEILPTQKNAKILDEETVFSATLDHQTHALDRFREEQEENILKVTEEIQKKVSGLKKL
jgi:flagellar biogenesis protein FliO